MPIAFTSVAPVFPVRNVAVALEHYGKLGFEGKAYAEGDPADPVYGFIDWGPVSIHLARVPSVDPRHNMSACYLYVDDADALFERWSGAGVGGRLHPPDDTPYDLREFAHVDPDGNLLRVGSPLPPA